MNYSLLPTLEILLQNKMQTKANGLNKRDSLKNELKCFGSILTATRNSIYHKLLNHLNKNKLVWVKQCDIRLQRMLNYMLTYALVYIFSMHV